MKVVIIIPARMGSSRFPGKPLAKINGKTMIEHVYTRVCTCQSAFMTVVATCDEEIVDIVESFGGKAIMTSNSHQRASDRCAEALQKLEEECGQVFDIVVMVQGDEPMTHPDMVDESVQPFYDEPDVQVVNLMAKVPTKREFLDPNCIKVVVNNRSEAICFSRSPIPYNQNRISSIPTFKQVCVIPFRRDFLLKFNSLRPTTLEEAESIDMMRLIENGFPVRMVETSFITQAVDTESDRLAVEKLMRSPAFV